MRGYPQFSFWISITLVKIYVSCIIINRPGQKFELVGRYIAPVLFEMKCEGIYAMYFRKELEHI